MHFHAPTPPEATRMSEHIYKTVELTGSSKISSDEAIRAAIERASKTIRDIRWFHVTEVRGHVDGGKVAYWQVTLKIGFTLEG
ncbi:dodecin [Dyella solisilvae]|nr:dodecin [Dyella solisilvae]